MDISETTTSQESPITSPDFEIESSTAYVARVPNVAETLAKGTNEILAPKIKATTTTSSPRTDGKKTVEHTLDGLTIDATSLTELLKDRSNLDNRNDRIDCEANLRNKNASNLLNRSGLTLASSHPLMSPLTSGNSDSDQIQFNYPDVVPESEPLRIAANPDVQSTIVADDIRTKNLRDSSLVDVLSTGDGIVQEQHHDFLSSGEDSEPDLSQYLASVEPCFKSVSLVATSSANKLRLDESPKGDRRRKISLSNELQSGGDDGSSIETVSNQSFDDDFDDYLVEPCGDNQLISASVSSSLMDDGDPNDAPTTGLRKSGSKGSLGRESAGASLPQCSGDETKESRGWQKITLPDGKTRDIDMKVIEPFKRVLSHGGYLKAGGHNAIVVFSACYLPDRSRADYHYVMDNLFYYVVNTLEQLVTEDYVLIYLHGGSTRSNVPSFPWLKKCYQLLDRRLRKSLKNLFMVHPSIWLKSIVWMARPFIRYEKNIAFSLHLQTWQ